MQKFKIQKHSPVVNAFAYQAMFSKMQNFTLASKLRPSRFFVKVFCIIYLFFLIIIAYSTKILTNKIHNLENYKSHAAI